LDLKAQATTLFPHRKAFGAVRFLNVLAIHGAFHQNKCFTPCVLNENNYGGCLSGKYGNIKREYPRIVGMPEKDNMMSVWKEAGVLRGHNH
jgi:hypothetical protein